MEKVKTFEAHQDYIRALAVHDQLPYVLSSSDDMTVKLWDWSKGWQNTMIFEGHSHYVMSVTFNPKDPNTFATASLDKTVKVWNLTSTVPNFTLEGHEKGVNCVEFYPGGDKPYIISGSDDRTARVWDYQTKCCIQTLAAHSHNVTCVMFHPDLPLILTGSEDETVKIWQMATYRLETTLDYGLERVWSVAVQPGTNKICVGCDKGSVVVKLGKDRFVHSMDQNGKIIMAINNEIQQINVKTAVDEVVDGEKIALPVKELGTAENVPIKLEHNPNGQFVALVSEGEYVINTALAWRAKCFGQCLQFAWTQETGGYAILETPGLIKTFKNFKQKSTFKPPASVDGLFGGPLMCLRCEDVVYFYDWDQFEKGAIRKIAASPKNIFWNESGELVCLSCDTSFFVLRYNRDLVQQHFDSGAPLPEDGIEDAFELLEEVDDRVRHGSWIGDCFLYTNRNQRLNYYIGAERCTLAVLDRHMNLLGYVPKENRVFLVDKERNIVSYQMDMSVIEYQTAIVRGDLEGAQKIILPKVPEQHRPKIARFLDAQGHKEIAMNVTTDDEHKFELAVALKRLDIVHTIAKRAGSVQKWKQMGDLAMQLGKLTAAAEALENGEDYNGLLLLHSSVNDVDGLQRLADAATEKGKYNVAFTAAYLVGDMEACVKLLLLSNKVPEAAFFARTHCPRLVGTAVRQWRERLPAKQSEAIADPDAYPNLFPEIPRPEPQPELGDVDAVEPEAEPAAPAAPAPASTEEEAEEEEEAEAEAEEPTPQPAATDSAPVPAPEAAPVAPVAPVAPADTPAAATAEPTEEEEDAEEEAEEEEPPAAPAQASEPAAAVEPATTAVAAAEPAATASTDAWGNDDDEDLEDI
eukprot:TRINITY_DN1674_c0_g1_i1.p1 TRINITY_DN1674_c0_g1~~TRINITY_DN1674_c0_g1_i1.p1  ORF type:complete len:960 (-),score=214.18 TRINITY_DN1674_c0_g1_i1:111-2699(-)